MLAQVKYYGAFSLILSWILTDKLPVSNHCLRTNFLFCMPSFADAGNVRGLPKFRRNVDCLNSVKNDS